LKLLNASKFVLGIGTVSDLKAVTEAVDQALLAELAAVIDNATAAFDGYDYTGALEYAERFFWQFCDDYLELVKERAYGSSETEPTDAALSARATLTCALDVTLRLLAPIMPFVTEEVWSWWREGSIHRASWPTAAEAAVEGEPELLDDVAVALAEIRGAKSKAKVSMKTEVSMAKVYGPAPALARLPLVESDLRAVGRMTGDLSWVEADGPIAVDVTLAAAR
jgi:valyl-tRNA synthetase